MVNILLNYSVFSFLLLCPLAIMAKIKDPEALIVDGIAYRSHANEVEATDLQSKDVRWHKIVYATVEPKHSGHQLERDVQWNIIRSLTREGDNLRVENKQREVFFLNLKTGDAVISDTVPKELVSLEGKTFLAIQAALVPFQSQKLEVAFYRIKVMQEQEHVVVVFIDKSSPRDFRGRGTPGPRPGFEVRLDSGTLRILSSNFIH